MGLPVLIVGKTGSGKTRSILNLPPQHSFIVNVGNKELSHKDLYKNYKEITKDNPKGNMIIADKGVEIVETIKYISEKRPEIQNLIIDDNQYVASFEYFRRVYESAYYKKYTDIGVDMFNIIMAIKAARKDLKAFVLHHSETIIDERGIITEIKAKTIGKSVDKNLSYEGLFTTVLGAEVEEVNGALAYSFITQSNGITSFKSPEGMFDTLKIPNDLQLVAEAIDNYRK